MPLDTHTLPGWPAAENPSGLYFFVLLLVVPLTITAVLALLVTGSALVKRNRASSMGVAGQDAPPLTGGPATVGISASTSRAAALTVGEQPDHVVVDHADDQPEEALEPADRSTTT